MDFKQKFEPANRKVLHGAGQSFEAFKKYWEAVGKYKPIIYMTYAKIPKIAPWIDKIKMETKKLPKEIMLQIGLKLLDAKGNDKTRDILDGKYDKDLDCFFRVIKDLGNRTFLRVGYEFDKKDKYNPTTFVKAWKYIVDKYRKLKVENIATVWCACPYNGTSPVEQYYPGDDYVDWFGGDVFASKNLKGDYKPVEDFLKLSKKHKKPVMIGESTPAKIGVDNEESWEIWFKPYFKWINSHPIIKAFCYINWDWAKDYHTDWGNCRVEESEFIRKNILKNYQILNLSIGQNDIYKF